MEKKAAKKSNNIQQKESYSRMNFLYQASHLMAGRNDKLSSYYGNLCKMVGKRSVVRMEPDMKRSICRRCGIAWKAGKTTTLQAKGDDVFVVKCNKCKYEREFRVNEDYNLWLDNPSSVAEVLNIQKDPSPLQNDELEAVLIGDDDRPREVRFCPYIIKYKCRAR